MKSPDWERISDWLNDLEPLWALGYLACCDLQMPAHASAGHVTQLWEYYRKLVKVCGPRQANSNAVELICVPARSHRRHSEQHIIVALSV